MNPIKEEIIRRITNNEETSLLLTEIILQEDVKFAETLLRENVNYFQNVSLITPNIFEQIIRGKSFFIIF